MGKHETKMTMLQVLQTHTACICIPLRLAVVLSGLVYFLVCAIFLMLESAGVYTFGGFSHQSRVINCCVEVFGLWFGLVGVGSGYRQDGYLAKVYLVCQIIALVVCAVGILGYDGPAMLNCEQWVENVESMTSQYGWNDLMYHMALNETCASHRALYLAETLVLWVFQLFTIYTTIRWVQDIETQPNYVLRFDEADSSYREVPRLASKYQDFKTFDHSQQPASGSPPDWVAHHEPYGGGAYQV